MGGRDCDMCLCVCVCMIDSNIQIKRKKAHTWTHIRSGLIEYSDCTRDCNSETHHFCHVELTVERAADNDRDSPIVLARRALVGAQGRAVGRISEPLDGATHSVDRKIAARRAHEGGGAPGQGP